MQGLSPDKFERVQAAVTRRAPSVQSMAAAAVRRRLGQARTRRVREALFGQQERERRLLESLRRAYIAARESMAGGARG